jgi:hypothetical protein
MTMEEGKPTFEPVEPVEPIKKPEVEPEIVEFDTLMKSAISKIKDKKAINDEAKALISLIVGYRGSFSVMQNVKDLLLGKDDKGKLEIISGFIKDIAKTK